MHPNPKYRPRQEDLPALFVRGDETEAAWKWIDGIVAGWKETHLKPEPYWAGSDGPDRAEKFWCKGHKP